MQYRDELRVRLVLFLPYTGSTVFSKKQRRFFRYMPLFSFAGVAGHIAADAVFIAAVGGKRIRMHKRAGR